MEASVTGTTTETGIDEKHRSFTSLRSKAMARRPAGIALPMPAANTAAATSSATTPCTVPHPITSLRPPPLTDNKQVKTWLVKIDRMKRVTGNTDDDGPSTQSNHKRRADQPPEHHHRRGNKQPALHIAADERLLEAVEETYHREMLSEADTSTYNLITWVELHNAYGNAKKLDPWPIYPLAPTIVWWELYLRLGRTVVRRTTCR